MEKILNAADVSVSYPDNSLGIFARKKQKQVLHNVSLSIRRREFFGLVGESGCGKSTFGNAVLGLVPFGGSIRIDGHDRAAEARPVFTRLVQAVFQDPLGALNPKKTVGFTMEEPLRINGIGTPAEREEKVCRMLETVGLDASCRRRYPQELSGGQRQRVCIGAALMLDPRLIIADEAVSALDVSVGSQILNLFREIHRDRELSLLFISHNLDIVYYMCDRIAVMYRGRIVEQGSADDVYRMPRHPYTRLLLSSIPVIGAQDGGRNAENAPLETLRPACSGACCFYHRCPHAEERCRTMQQLLPCGGTEHLVRCWKFADTRNSV